MIDFLLKNVTLDGDQRLDVAVDNGLILQRSPNLDVPARHQIDLAGRLLIPGFVESHLHLDIALMNDPQKPGRLKPYRSMAELNADLERRRSGFTKQEIVERASCALELASRHGVTALRAQCHVDLQVKLSHIEALQEIKEKYAGLVSVQIVAFPQQGLLQDSRTVPLFRDAFQAGADVMGCASNLDRSPLGQVDFHNHIDACFALAAEQDVNIDIHADLSIPERIELEDLEVVHAARRTIEYGYQGRATAGHVCSLDSALPDVAARAIEWIARAQMSVISQPDLYRLGREDTHHVRRGLTRVKQLLAAGVNVAYASNNVRDAMRPLGNFDLLEEGLILAYGAHMDTISELETLLRMSTYNAARALCLDGYGLEPGCQADLVVLDAFSPSEAIVGQAEKLYVFKTGRLVAANRVTNESFFKSSEEGEN